MTSEILIMNKEAIALAADSAVTIGPEGDKIFHPQTKSSPYPNIILLA